jgi:anti-sigma factor RsiW
MTNVANHLDNDEFLLHAYCDGELDPATTLEFERRMAVDDLLRARHDQIISLRQALKLLPQQNLPKGLDNRVNSALDRKVRNQRNWSWQALAAAALIGAVLASSIMLAVDRYSSQQNIARQAVASHIRSLLASQPFDIASSDRHTVKPWFTTRLPVSPPVIELASDGFTLAGGRIDVIGQNPVATIVYRHDAHIVSLTTIRPGQTIFNQTIAGYNLRSWSDGNFTYVAVSDLLAKDLSSFETAFKTVSTPP